MASKSTLSCACKILAFSLLKLYEEHFVSNINLLNYFWLVKQSRFCFTSSKFETTIANTTSKQNDYWVLLIYIFCVD